MTLLLVRDDDANTTTLPLRIERAYAPLLDAGVPICFSVIPEVALDTRDPAGARERFLDDGSEDCERLAPLTPEAPLAGWLRRHRGAVDVMAHGLSHRRLRGGTEFGALDEAEASSRIERAIAILERALGSRPTGFVAPWDALSAGALTAAVARFQLVSTSWVDLPRLPRAAWPSFVVERVLRSEALRVGGAWVVRHRGGRVAPRTPPEQVGALVDGLARGADLAVIVLHHWMFWDDAEPHPVVTALARALRGRRVGTVHDAVRHLDALPPRPLRDLANGCAARVREWALTR